MPTSKELREQLKAPAAEIKRLAVKANDESQPWTAEDEQTWDRVNAEYSALETQVADAEALEKDRAAKSARAAEVAERLKAPAGDPLVGRADYHPRKGRPSLTPAHDEELAALALQGWMRHQSGLEATEEQEAAAVACGVRLRSPFYEIGRPVGRRHAQMWEARGQLDFRAAGLGVNPPTAGGYTVPETLITSLELAMLAFGGIRRVADVMTTTSGEPMFWPTANDTSNTGRLIAPGTAGGAILTTATHPTFAAVAFNAYKYTSDFILIDFELLQDSAFNLPQIVGAMLGERLGRITATHFTTGDGAAKPTGIVTDAALGVTAASATAIAADELFDLEHSIDPAYRTMGCGWMFHDTILKALRKLKDGNGRYLWQEGLSTGAPNVLLDYPYTISQDMASSIAASAKTVLFGQLSKYKIRDVAGVRLRRLDERYAENDQVAFVALSRHDGKLLDAGVAPVKYLVQA